MKNKERIEEVTARSVLDFREKKAELEAKREKELKEVEKQKEETKKEILNSDAKLDKILKDEWGLKNVESIIDNEFIDLVYVGTYDIAQTLGKSANHKDVFKILEKTTKIIRDSNKSVGCLLSIP